MRWRGQDTVAVSVLILIGTWLPGHLAPAAGAPTDVVRDGIVASVAAATVMEFAERVEGTLFLKYRDGATAIAVPATTEIHRLVVSRVDELRKGMHVVVRGVANPDGSIAASSITADEP